MKYVLGAGAVLALLKGHSLVVTRLDIAGKQAVSVPQPVWAELAYGLERLAPGRKNVLRERLRFVRDELARAYWTDEVSEHFGAIKAELDRHHLTMGDHQVALAAHAMAAGAVLVTREVELMSRVEGLEVEDWEN